MRANLQSPLAETAAGAIAQSVLQACVHCGMCNATCPTYQITGDELDGPRGRIYLIKQALEGAPAGRVTQTHLDRCLSCRACETTCPSGVEYHRLLDIGREALASTVRRPWSERLLRWALRGVVPHRRRIALAIGLGRRLAGLLPTVLRRKIPPSVAPGRLPSRLHARRMALLGGCVQSALAGHFNAATRRVFDHLAITLNDTASVGCCGALAFHLEAPEAARQVIRRNIDAWLGELDAGAEAIVVNASGCAAFIRDYPDVLADDPTYLQGAIRVARAVRDPIEIVGPSPPAPARPPARPRVAVHDPCTLRNGPGLGGAVARLLGELGYDVRPTADAHLCCGSAGAYSLLQPAFAARLRADKLAALGRDQPDDIYTANIGCWMHLGETSSVPVRHWIEAVDDLLEAPPPRGDNPAAD